MPNPNKKLANKVGRIRTQILSLRDDLRGLCQFEGLIDGANPDPDSDPQNAWSFAIRRLESSAEVIIDLADELCPNPPELDDDQFDVDPLTSE